MIDKKYKNIKPIIHSRIGHIQDEKMYKSKIKGIIDSGEFEGEAEIFENVYRALEWLKTLSLEKKIKVRRVNESNQPLFLISGILKVCKGEYPNYLGCKFEFYNDKIKEKYHIKFDNFVRQKFLNRKDHNKSIASFNLNGEFLKTYDNIIEILEDNNFRMTPTSVIGCCRKNKLTKSVNGKEYRFTDDLAEI